MGKWLKHEPGNVASRNSAPGVPAPGHPGGEDPRAERPGKEHPGSEYSRDAAMMRLALEAAEEAAAKNEVPVGAVVARGDEVLAVATNEREATKDPTAHAELLAIRRAADTLGGWRLSECTLYSTLEPCPMCAGAAHAARLSRIVFAAPDPKAGYAGTLHDTPGDKNLNHLIPVESGLLEDEAASLLRDFFKARRLKNRGSGAAQNASPPHAPGSNPLS